MYGDDSHFTYHCTSTSNRNGRTNSKRSHNSRFRPPNNCIISWIVQDTSFVVVPQNSRLSHDIHSLIDWSLPVHWTRQSLPIVPFDCCGSVFKKELLQFIHSIGTMTIATTNAMNGEVHEPVFDPYKKLKQRLETTKSHKESVQVRPFKMVCTISYKIYV